MMSGRNKITIYIITIAIFFLILFFSISAPILVSESDFSIYNPGWNGCSDLAVKTREMGNFAPNIELAEGTQTEVTQRELSEYEVEPENTGLMMIGPRQGFEQENIEYVHDFLQEGGIAVIADDFGTGNTLLEGLDTNSSFHPYPLLDLAFEEKPERGVSYNFTEHDITQEVSQVELNSPTAIDKDENATTLMRSSEASWLDENENGVKDEDESFEQYPLMTTEEYGEGELILVSDPSIFINSMLERKDNRQLAENILDHLSEGRANIIFDESHREISFLYRIVYTGELPNRIIAVLLSLVGLSIGIYSTVSEDDKGFFEKIRYIILHFVGEEEEETDTVGKVLNDHPDWDEEKLKMINERFIEGEIGDD